MKRIDLSRDNLTLGSFGGTVFVAAFFGRGGFAAAALRAAAALALAALTTTDVSPMGMSCIT